MLIKTSALSSIFLLSIDGIHGFTTTPSPFKLGIHHSTIATSLSLSKEKDNEDEEEDERPPPSGTPNLGIDIGAQLTPLTPRQAADLKEEATQTINEAFSARIDEIENLKTEVRRDFERSKKNLEYESDLRAEKESKKLMGKIDRLSGEFLERNEELRMGTKMAARADVGMKGKGLDVGSWGKIGGMDVLTAAGGGAGMTGGLLGSVGAANALAESLERSEEGDEVQERDNRILVVCDDKQDKNIQKVIDRFATLLEESKVSTSPIQIDTYKPTSTLPLGGNNAQCAIIVAPSLSNGRQSAEAILGRILKRTLQPGGGKVSTPPTHLVVISSIGTERTEKYPYSMKNMMGGGKLNKQRDVEEVIVSTVKGRMVVDSNAPGSVPLDYSIVKLGDVVEDSKIKKIDSDGMIQIRPGDTLDGNTGLESAANVLLQAVAMQSKARNATMSVVGGMSKANQEDIDEYFWDDQFERLDGPELWRVEGDGDIWNMSDDEEKINRMYDELTSFIGEWALVFDNGAKGTGLTTPVSIVPSFMRKKMEKTLSISEKWGMRLEFKQTNTGSAYKSKDEERELEQQRPSGYSNNGSKKIIVSSKQKREGGIEVLVEKVVGKDGDSGIRVRARRCNMDDFAVVKELSEEVIVKSLQKAVSVWEKEVKGR